MILFRSIGFTLATVVFFALGQARAAEAKRPNILFVMADDLGWMDLACQGNKLVETPHLDSLAKQGMRFWLCGGTGLFSHKGRCAHGAGSARLGMTSHLPGKFSPKDNRPQPADMIPAIGPSMSRSPSA